MPSTEELRIYPQQNASTGALQQMGSRLPALEEEVHLDEYTGSTTSEESDSPRNEGRLSKVTSALSAKLGFFKSKKGKEPETEAGGAGNGNGNGNGLPTASGDRQWTNYTSNMVDVLDTVGMCACVNLEPHVANQDRPRSADAHLHHQHPKFALRPQSWKVCEPPTDVQPAART